MKALCGAATALTCVGAAVSLTASPAAAGPEPRTFGPSFVYDDRYAEVLTAVTVRASERSTAVTLEASNFPRSAYGRTFGAHVHIDRCGPRPTDAGKHYQTRDGKGSLRDREVWLDFTVDQQGRALVRAERPWAIPAGAANSVVVHSRATDKGGDAGDPILCTTVPFAGHQDKAAKEPKKAEKHAKKDEKRSGHRTDGKSPEPKAEHHAHAHEPRAHEHHGRDHGRGHDEIRAYHHDHEGRDHHEARDHRDHDGRDHHKGRDVRDHEVRHHHDGRDHDGRDRGEYRDHDGRDRDGRDHHEGRDGRDHDGRDRDGREPRRHEARDHDGRDRHEHAGDRREGIAEQARATARAQQKQWTKPYQSVLDMVRGGGQWQGQRLTGGN